MSGSQEKGERPRGELTSQRLKREQTQQGSPECEPLSSVWNVLEREVRLRASDVGDGPRLGSQEYKREFDEVNRLEEEIYQKGSTRERHIFDLFYTMTTEPGQFPNPAYPRDVTLEEFQ